MIFRKFRPPSAGARLYGNVLDYFLVVHNAFFRRHSIRGGKSIVSIATAYATCSSFGFQRFALATIHTGPRALPCRHVAAIPGPKAGHAGLWGRPSISAADADTGNARLCRVTAGSGPSFLLAAPEWRHDVLMREEGVPPFGAACLFLADCPTAPMCRLSNCLQGLLLLEDADSSNVFACVSGLRVFPAHGSHVSCSNSDVPVFCRIPKPRGIFQDLCR